MGGPRDAEAQCSTGSRHPAGGETSVRAPTRPQRSTQSRGTISERERKAFTSLILEHDKRLRGLAFRLVGDAGLMDDALQEAYAKAFVAFSGFRWRSSAGTWLYRITYTTCIDVLRRQRRLVGVGDDLLEEAADPAPDLADDLAERDLLATALAALPLEQRAAVLLVDRDGFDYKTVADILDVPTGTVASRVWAARQTLRRALRPERMRE